MSTDVLGEAYTARTIELARVRGVDTVATLVRRRADGPAKGALLYVHGFADYFFQTHVAEFFCGLGYDFYGLDLRGYGRSLRPGQLPNFVSEMSEHFEELDAAARLIHEDGHDRLVLMGHSTGGLTVALWAAARRGTLPVDAIVLNSPWLDLAEPWLSRTVGTALVRLIGRWLPNLVVKKGLAPTYTHSLMRSEHGEWEYNLDWKPVEAYPVRAGWLRAVRRGHARVHKGIDVGVPVLVLTSDKSLLHREVWEPAADKADTVLDVAHMARWSPMLGRDVTVTPLPDALHDVFLSAPAVRERALAEAADWLTARTAL
ncbi:alpha-beta hydrolase superfamily lysophospholipase [Crossiella equi]|uniref:Alpha-beta hydrolase superfamily lysophospholipase n=1 Tax=Crossiella equi TaxID=130796 RepID=A0ABS5AKM2_9PSEU|nr:alpha/beta hydrolase [Crossiella equi]MBP2477119.1 alpha-beta hydrolase superfamily lysophospholipase [Crossiella equi]